MVFHLYRVAPSYLLWHLLSRCRSASPARVEVLGLNIIRRSHPRGCIKSPLRGSILLAIQYIATLIRANRQILKQESRLGYGLACWWVGDLVVQ